jgi:mono/diheme cytochrome c family protein
MVLFSSGITSLHAAEIDKAKWTEGKALFKSNCASCHNPTADGTGPALKGAPERWAAAGSYKGKTGTQWLHIWITNWHDAVDGGYKYAVDMRHSRPAEMNVFKGILQYDDIDKILLYVDNPDLIGPPTAAAQPGAAGSTVQTEEGSNTTLYIFIGFLIVLVLILISVTNKLDKIIDEKEGKIPPSAPSIPLWKRTNVIAAVVLLVFVFLTYFTVDAWVHFGRQQNYSPVQPIRFSHALHAGVNKINCQYCHQNAYNGKHSNIPSLNTCMNCHKDITKGPKYGTEEIAKIYDAIGWDVTSKTYSKPQHPVEWVRIDNLPDFVYFNHSQHVNVGKIQCQTCHGPVETMDQVYQYSPLSMGWCINCHRNTEVQFASNNYYTTYGKIHDDLQNGILSKVTVETIGGTECQKCHY